MQDRRVSVIVCGLWSPIFKHEVGQGNERQVKAVKEGGNEADLSLWALKVA